jgi:hypothetical protein
MPSLSWYLNRLGRMSAAEISYRAAQAARVSVDRIAVSLVSAPPIESVPRSTGFMQRPMARDTSAYIADAQRILAGRYSLFHLQDQELGNPPEWNRDPLTGTLAPLKPAGWLDYRDEKLVGNIKYLWEPNRHLHIPKLAQAYALTGDPVYATTVRTHIESWIDQCPAGRGANWTSSLELAIRLINWSIAWQLLGGYGAPLFADAGGRAFRDRWMQSVYLQVRAITRKLSRFSSANNHLIGETAGVYIASMTWNCWSQMRAWGLQCKEILMQEALVQNAEDGGNREQAFSYQQFVLDFLLLAGLAARAAHEDFPADYWERIERMMEFLASMMDVSGNVPMIGDADDGYVVSLAPASGLGTGGWTLEPGRAPRTSESSLTAADGRQPTASPLPAASSLQSPAPLFDNYRSLLATGAALFKRADFARKLGEVDDKTRWLVPPEELSDFARLANSRGPAIARRSFPQSGYYVLGSHFDTPEEVRMIVDAGPLGYLSIAAHGHADALSIVLNVGGEEVLVDPGTYSYHTEPEWRRYFRSTRAHNTVVVDDTDQSVQSGNFMWSQHAVARCLHFGEHGEVQRFLGEHDGYCNLREPVEHQREILYDTLRRVFTITDILEGEGTHEICHHWHFPETVEPSVRDDEVCVLTARHRIRIVPEEMPVYVGAHRGGTPEQGGWISRRFGHKEPSTTVAWRSVARGRTIFRTYIYIEKREGDRG